MIFKTKNPLKNRSYTKLVSKPPTGEISENLVKPGNDNSTKNRILEP